MDEQQKERVTEWVKALRSGEYKQGRHALRRFDTSDSYCYCCLGVACEISRLGDWNDDNEYYDDFRSSDSYLPPQTADYYGLTHVEQLALTKMNDSGSDFSEIADFIEQKLLKRD